MFSDAVDREAAWLSSVDDLPTLSAADGGPFQVLQARWPRTPAKRQTALYVTRQTLNSYSIKRESSQRTLPTVAFSLQLLWPMVNGLGEAEADQLAFDQAIDSVITRVLGPLGDKTHGGRFLSAAEDRQGVTVHLSDPENAIATDGVYRALVTYTADDLELIN